MNLIYLFGGLMITFETLALGVWLFVDVPTSRQRLIMLFVGLAGVSASLMRGLMK